MAEGLFENIYNPDVLSCLANLSNDEVFTPPDVVNQMLDMLPQELFTDPNTKFLDPACKSGVFLREIAKRLIAGLEPIFPDLQERVDHILHNQLFGIAITELTSLMSRRSLYCSKYPNSEFSVSQFDDVEGNIRYRIVKHTWDKDGKCVFCGAAKSEYSRDEELESHAYEWIHVAKPEEIFRMNFDVIIGNPPYQLSTASENIGSQAKPIYDKFVLQSIKLNPRFVVMITPSRWFAAGWGLDEFREKMINSNHVKEIHDYNISSDCFAGVEIKGGVSYFLYARDYNGKCKFSTHIGDTVSSVSTRYLKEKNCDGLIRFNELVPIYHKMLAVEGDNFRSFSEMVTGRSPFGFNTNHHGSKEKTQENDVPYLERSGYTYMPRASITRNESAIGKYKVYISNAYGAGEGYPHQIINKPILGPAGTICSGTFLMVGPFSNRTEAENVKSYMSTKFFRALVMINKVSQHASYLVYKAVPMQDFSMPWTDEALYKKYGLTNDEIDFIESMIRPMDLGGDDDA